MGELAEKISKIMEVEIVKFYNCSLFAKALTMAYSVDLPKFHIQYKTFKNPNALVNAK